MPFHSWLGGALAEALQAPKATPIIARPAPPAKDPPNSVLDRETLPEGTERTAAANRKLASTGKALALKAEGAHTKQVLEVPERLVSLLLGMPYQAVKRAQSAGLNAAMNPYNFGASPTRELSLEGPAATVADMAELIEGMVWDLHQRHGLDNEPLRKRVAAAASKHQTQFESGSAQGPLSVKVSLDGTEEEVHVDKEMGPLWWNRHLRPTFGPLDNGRLAAGTKEWREMSTTEREVFLILTAKRQRQLTEQSA